MTSAAVRASALRVHAAWTNAGPVPAVHIEKQMQLMTEWPTLFNALNDLVYVLDMEDVPEAECANCGRELVRSENSWKTWLHKPEDFRTGEPIDCFNPRPKKEKP